MPERTRVKGVNANGVLGGNNKLEADTSQPARQVHKGALGKSGSQKLALRGETTNSGAKKKKTPHHIGGIKRQ